MTVRELLDSVVNGTDVRVRELGGKDVTGTLSMYKRADYYRQLAERGIDSCLVTNIYPLHRSQELYIECARVVE